MAVSVCEDSGSDAVLSVHELKRVCRANGIRLSANAFACLNELARGLLDQASCSGCPECVTRPLLLRELGQSRDGYEHVKAIWASVLGSVDGELFPILARAHRVLELHWACMSKHVLLSPTAICCEEVLRLVPLVNASAAVSQPTTAGGERWIQVTSGMAFVSGIVEWIVRAAGLVQRQLGEYCCCRITLC